MSGTSIIAQIFVPLSEHRQKYIKPYYYRNPNTLKLNSLMNHSNKTVVKNLCIFVQIIMKTVKDFNQ